MLKKNIIKKILNFLTNLARTEKKIDLFREKLCQLEVFEPYSSFKRIDKENKNFINFSDIRIFLKENSIYFDEETIVNTYIQHYDYDGDEKLSYAE